jgi:hypothetical protein
MSHSASTAIEVRELVREFKGGIRAVDGLDLEVPPTRCAARSASRCRRRRSTR